MMVRGTKFLVGNRKSRGFVPTSSFTWSETLTSLGLSFPYVKKDLDETVLKAVLKMLEDLILGFPQPRSFLGVITTRSSVLRLCLRLHEGNQDGPGEGSQDSGGGEAEEVVGQAPTHTYSSSSYSLGGQTATTRSIQSCREKVCDSGYMLRGQWHVCPLYSIPIPGHPSPGSAGWALLPMGR